VRVLGVNCTTRDIYLAVADQGQILDGLTERLRPPVGLEEGAALIELVDSMRRVIREVRPDKVELLQPEAWSASYSQHLPRARLETLIQFAAATEEIPLETLSRPTARARLNVPRTGPLESHIAIAGTVVGRYWTSGRGLAAMAAKAGEGK
jgi:hypothetical protein